MLAHCIMTLSSVWPAIAGSMSAFMPEHLSIQMFVVLQAPVHACALRYDTIECLTSRCWQHECVHASASELSDVVGASGTDACLRIAL